MKQVERKENRNEMENSDKSEIILPSSKTDSIPGTQKVKFL